MKISIQQLAAALDTVSEHISKADSAFEDYANTGDEWAQGSADWYAKQAYATLIALCEAWEMPALRRDIEEALKEAANQGFLTTDRTPDGDPYMKALGPARRYHSVLQAVFGTEPSRTVTKDLEAILRETTYAITDTVVFGRAPMSEEDVHRRIEVVLRCIFPDLLHKPRLTKAIKNFEPDSGIPSIATLIEYKFISDRARVNTVADEVLADTRGYTHKDWKAFIYVIYETERFRPESQWRQLLRECDAAVNTTVIVLTGNAIRRRRASRVTAAK